MANRKESRVRNQVVTPRKRRIQSQRPPARKPVKAGDVVRSLAAFAKPVALVLGVVLILVAYHALAGSAAFQLKRVNVADAGPSLREEVEQAVRRAVGQSGLLEVNLVAVRQKVEALARVRSATVGRMLPDGLFVRVVERVPVVLVRRESGPREGKLVWYDDEAVEVGEFSEVKSDGPGAREVPPIAKGFAEGLRSQAMVAEDKERVALYKSLQREFSQGPASLWSLIDQIDLTFTKDVNVFLARPAVQIHVGGMDFRKRFERALEVLNLAQQGNREMLNHYRVQDVDRLIQNASNISFIDAVRSERIVVNLTSPGAQKTSKQE
jgi:hypothetical protein